jgi:hypothetical protein
MTRLDWQWCHENEWYLRELVRQTACGESCKDSLAAAWPGPSFLLSEPAPLHANLYLALRLFDQELKTGVSEDRLRDLISWGLPAITLQVRSLWGQTQRRWPAAF